MLVLAIPDHPWVDGANGAAVRIAMTVGSSVAGEGRLLCVTDEQPGSDGEMAVALAQQNGRIHADLSIGANIVSVAALKANSGITSRGVMLFGAGFIVTQQQSLAWPSLPTALIREYRNGRDLTDRPRGVKVIDAFGLSAEQLRTQAPDVYQHLLDHVKPERDTNRDAPIRQNWWLHGRTRGEIREALKGLPRYIATVETAKHRTFQFLDASILPDNMLVAIASSEAHLLGVLSSQVHVTWALAQGGTLEDRPRYNKSRCFETFPFPDEDTGLTPALRERIAGLAEQMDAQRKRQQATHPGLTLTGMYNVLEALRAGRVLTPKEQTIHNQGLVGVLKELHNELDTAVLQAYGWPADIARDDLLTRLVALNAQRAAEEKNGKVRWLRPDFQNPQRARTLQNQEQTIEKTHWPQAEIALNLPENSVSDLKTVLTRTWPATLPEQVRGVAELLAGSTALSLTEIEARFKGRGPWKKSLPRILETLEALGRARRSDELPERWLAWVV